MFWLFFSVSTSTVYSTVQYPGIRLLLGTSACAASVTRSLIVTVICNYENPVNNVATAAIMPSNALTEHGSLYSHPLAPPPAVLARRAASGTTSRTPEAWSTVLLYRQYRDRVPHGQPILKR
jgi:hypothetical protein